MRFVLLAAALICGLAGTDLARARECCSRHGGISDCDQKSGLYRCADGYVSDCPCKPAAPFYRQGRLIRAPDCKSLELKRNGRVESVRLYGIICPDRHKKVAPAGVRHVTEFCEDKTIEVEPVGIDRQGRELAWVTYSGVSLNVQLVRRGLAYWDRAQAPARRDFEEAEAEARRDHRGIWSETARPEAR